MPALADSKKDELARLYAAGNSARRIAAHFDISLDATYYALRRFNIQRRDKKAANAAAFAMKPVSFQLKQNLTAEETELKAHGVALYWGEGYKAAGATGVDFANSDERMIRVFLAFLRRICGVDERKLRIFLYCHDYASAVHHIRYWSRVTKVPKRQFTKPYVAKRASIKGKGMPHGLIHVRYNDKKLLGLIRSWIQEYSDRY